MTDVASEAPVIGLKSTNASALVKSAVLIGTDATFAGTGTGSLDGTVLTISGGAAKDQLFLFTDGTLTVQKREVRGAGGAIGTRSIGECGR